MSTTHTESRFPNRMLRMPSGGNMQSCALIGLRVAQLVSALIIMSLTAYVADWYNSDTLTNSPAQVNWLLACSVVSIFSLLYLEAAKRFVPRAFHPTAALALESINALFHFSGFVYLAVFIGRLLFCRGSVCAAARAASAFGAFEFPFWCVSASLAAKEMRSSGVGPGFSMAMPRLRRNNRGGAAAAEKAVAMEEGGARAAA